MFAAPRSLFDRLVLSAVLMLASSAWGADPPGKLPGDDRDVIYRADLIANRWEPVAAKELKPGYIYNRYSQELGRRVWSFVQADGRFWQAFGEGTTQEAWRFDIRATETAIRQRVEAMPALARQLDQTAGRVYMQLSADGTWKVAGTELVASLYSAESGQRWELQGPRYIPVVHSTGDRWQIRNSRYVPQ